MGTAAVRDSGAPGRPEEPFDLPCVRCGVCCTVYQVRISPTEARQIADCLGMEYWDWVGRYCDPRWSDPRSHLIRHDDGGCVFLERSSEEVALCRIYGVRPASCRDWCAGVFKPACQDWLKRFWQVGVDSSGQLQGTPESLSRLEEFVRLL
jgi:hypothetical protein